MRIDPCDAGDICNIPLCLSHDRNIVQIDDIAMAENVRLQPLEQAALPKLGEETFHCFLTADELCLTHIGYGKDRLFQRLCFFVGQILVHKGHYGILVLKIGDNMAYIQGDQSAGTHDQQAGNNDHYR